MGAFDFVIDHATFHGGPWDNALSSAAGIAHIFLLEDFGEAGAVLAVLDELFAGQVGAPDFVDFIDEAELDGVEEGDAVMAPALRGRGHLTPALSPARRGSGRGATGFGGGFAAEG